ncbi:MAG: cytochrome P450 [Linnemannia elongata]|nr:MAG: cytochrome P450 [Linnemannia elongata]
MAVLSTLNNWPFLKAFLDKYPKSLADLKKPRSIVRIIATFIFLNALRKFIITRYFDRLSHLPAGLFAFTYVFTGLGVYSGRSHYFLPKTHERYGKVVRVAPNIVSVADKDAIHEILVGSDYPKSEIHEGLELYKQHNLFSSRNKDFHKNRRRLVAPAFGLQYLRSLEPIMAECIHILIRKIDEILLDPTSVQNGAKVLPKGHINICSFMNRLSLDIIGETAFGESFDMVKDDNHPIPKQMAKSLKRSMQQTFNPWMRWIVPIDYSFINFSVDCVNVRRQAGDAGRRADLLQFLIDAQASERASGNGETGDEYADMIAGKLTDRAVQTEALVFLIAGSETSSTAITVALMYLVKHPKALRRLREELDQATASNPTGALPTYDQVRKLTYLTACINESMRLRPVAATGLPREVTEDTVMGGYNIPKGTIVLAQISQLHHNADYFPEPNNFLPERWIREESLFPPIQDFTFYPFSAGTRNCVGKNFAMMEMRLILATILTTYDIEYVPRQREDYVQFITTAFATESYVIKMKKRIGA